MDVAPFGSLAYFSDPGGAVFAVWQPGTHVGAGLVNEPCSFCHHELATRALDDCAEFYRDVFGWTSEPMRGDKQTCLFLSDGRRVAHGVGLDARFEGIPPHWKVYFAVADCDRTVARIEELGGEVRLPPTDIEPGRFSVVADDQGAAFSVIALSEPAK